MSRKPTKAPDLSGLCPYCGAPVNVDPEVEDDWGRLMCADCCVAGEGRCEPYRIEGAWVHPEMPDHFVLTEARVVGGAR